MEVFFIEVSIYGFYHISFHRWIFQLFLECPYFLIVLKERLCIVILVLVLKFKPLMVGKMFYLIQTIG